MMTMCGTSVLDNQRWTDTTETRPVGVNGRAVLVQDEEGAASLMSLLATAVTPGPCATMNVEGGARTRTQPQPTTEGSTTALGQPRLGGGGGGGKEAAASRRSRCDNSSFGWGRAPLRKIPVPALLRTSLKRDRPVEMNYVSERLVKTSRPANLPHELSIVRGGTSSKATEEMSTPPSNRSEVQPHLLPGCCGRQDYWDCLLSQQAKRAIMDQRHQPAPMAAQYTSRISPLHRPMVMAAVPACFQAVPTPSAGAHHPHHHHRYQMASSATAAAAVLHAVGPPAPVPPLAASGAAAAGGWGVAPRHAGSCVVPEPNNTLASSPAPKAPASLIGCCDGLRGVPPPAPAPAQAQAGQHQPAAAEPGRCPLCDCGGSGESPGGGGGEEPGRQRRRKRMMSKKRSHLRLGCWWKKYGYRGPAYCQRCSEVFRDHIMRRLSNSARCTLQTPCLDCQRVLAHFPKGVRIFQQINTEKR
jgi:hypothetical protein